MTNVWKSDASGDYKTIVGLVSSASPSSPLSPLHLYTCVGGEGKEEEEEEKKEEEEERGGGEASFPTLSPSKSLFMWPD